MYHSHTHTPIRYAASRLVCLSCYTQRAKSLQFLVRGELIKQAISCMIALNGPQKNGVWEGGRGEWNCGGGQMDSWWGLGWGVWVKGVKSWALIVVLGADESINNYDWCRSHFQMFLHGFTLEGRVRSWLNKHTVGLVHVCLCLPVCAYVFECMWASPCVYVKENTHWPDLLKVHLLYFYM